MKKHDFLLLLILLIAVLVVGCKKEDEPTTTPVGQTDELDDEDGTDVNINSELLAAFYQLLDETEDPTDLINFMDENLDKLGIFEGDIMVEALESRMDMNIEEFTRRLNELDSGELQVLAETEESFPENKIEEIEDGELKDFVAYLYENKYKLINLEGSYEPIIDYKKLEDYGEFVSDQWEEYFSLRALDSEERPFSDGALNISFSELAERILATERYLNTYIDSPRRDRLVEDYNNKFTAYLMGLPNTPIVDSEDKILDDVLESYKETAAMAGNMTGIGVGDYIKVIEDNNLLIDDNVLKFAESIIKESVRMMNEFK